MPRAAKLAICIVLAEPWPRPQERLFHQLHDDGDLSRIFFARASAFTVVTIADHSPAQLLG